MKSTDLVDVVWVLPSNHIRVTITVEEASKYMRYWWKARENIKIGTDEEKKEAVDWIEYGTFALNIVTDDGGDAAIAIVAWKYVQAIYCIPTKESFQDKSLKIQEKMVKLVEQQTDYYGQGEQWKGVEG